ncbi:MAG: STAS domain-containing protein [Candidatus Omnitrophota bacterium]
MPLLTVTINKNMEGVLTILPSGSIDSDTYEILDQNVDTAMKSAPRTLVFDMKDVKYVSSMGIRSLLGAKTKIEKLGGSLVMTNLQPQIRKVFDIVRAIPSQNIFTSREELDEYLTVIQQKEIDKNKRDNR